MNGLVKFVFYIVFYIAKYKLFKKMNEKGWKAFIPIYSELVLFRKTNVSKWYIVLYIILMIIDFFFVVGWLLFFALSLLLYISIVFIPFAGNVKDFADGILHMTDYIDVLVYFIQIYIGYKLALRFGKNKTESIILGIINPIEIILFGFDKSKYK